MNVLHMANVNEAGEEHDGEGCPIVLNELPDISMEELGVANDATEKRNAKDEQGDHDLEVGRSRASKSPLPSKDLDAFLEVD